MLHHPSYSPDFSLIEYYLFKHLNNFLQKKNDLKTKEQSKTLLINLLFIKISEFYSEKKQTCFFFFLEKTHEV